MAGVVGVAAVGGVAVCGVALCVVAGVVVGGSCDGGSVDWARALVSSVKKAETTKSGRTQGNRRPTPSLARTCFMTSLRQEGESRRGWRLPNLDFRWERPLSA